MIRVLRKLNRGKNTVDPWTTSGVRETNPHLVDDPCVFLQFDLHMHVSTSINSTVGHVVLYYAFDFKNLSISEPTQFKPNVIQ